MTYLQFHLVFLLPLIVVLALLQRRPIAGVGAHEAFKWLGTIMLIAFIYTTPWDNYLVYRDVWGYPLGAVLFTIGYVPIEEYLFFLLQPVIGGLFFFLLRGRNWLASPLKQIPSFIQWSMALVWILIACVGVGLLIHPSPNALYLGLILAWAAPVLAGLSWIGANKVWADRHRVVVSIAVPTVYLWFADRYAISVGIWDIRDAYSLGIDPLGLPIEEAIFFLVTMCLCVFGLVLFMPEPPARRTI